MKNGFILIIQNGKNHGLIWDNHQHRLQNQLDSARRQCCVFGGTRKVWCTTPGETVNTDRYRQQMINLNHALIEKRPEDTAR